MGHWSGDPECRASTINVVEEDVDEKVQYGDDQLYEAFVCTHVVKEMVLHASDLCSIQVLQASHVESRKHVDSCLGVIDTACDLECAGQRWWQDYRQSLISAGLQDMIVEDTSVYERFKSGNGGILESKLKVTCPIVLANTPMVISFYLVDSNSLALLIGRKILRSMNASIDLEPHRLKIGSRSCPLVDSYAGHMAVHLDPSWRTPNPNGGYPQNKMEVSF